jgi:hypothetical protein
MVVLSCRGSSGHGPGFVTGFEYSGDMLAIALVALRGGCHPLVIEEAPLCRGGRSSPGGEEGGRLATGEMGLWPLERRLSGGRGGDRVVAYEDGMTVTLFFVALANWHS